MKALVIILFLLVGCTQAPEPFVPLHDREESYNEELDPKVRQVHRQHKARDELRKKQQLELQREVESGKALELFRCLQEIEARCKKSKGDCQGDG